MNKQTVEELRARWGRDAHEKLVGRKIVAVRYMSEAEVDGLQWYGRAAVVIQLDNGVILFPSQDDEGNGPGAVFTSMQDFPTIPVI